MRVAIIGSGVVGSATGKGLVSIGKHDVIFYDINSLALDRLRKAGYKTGNIWDIDLDEDVYFLCVSTPTSGGQIDLNFITAAFSNLAYQIRNKKNSGYFVIVVRSTVVPGTCRRLMLLFEEISGKKAGKDFGICMNPEYLREVSAEEDFANPRIITIGALDELSYEKTCNVFQNFNCEIVKLNSMEEAEIQKYIHNCFNAVKISFFNEMRDHCRRIGIIDPDIIFQATSKSCEGCWNPSYGMKDLGPFGGACLPKDTEAYESWAKRVLGISSVMIKAAIKYNQKMIMLNGNGH